MSKTVWKFPLLPQSPSVVSMPRSAAVIHVGDNGDSGPVLWAIVETDAQLVDREFWVYGTDHELPSGITKRDHLGSVQTPSGLVWHVFEES